MNSLISYLFYLLLYRHPPHRTIDEFSIQDFRDLFELNMVSIFAASKFAIPYLSLVQEYTSEINGLTNTRYLRKTKGNIINMSSLVGAFGQLHATTYVG